MAEEKKTITSMMEEKRVFPPSKEFSAKAHIKSLDEYKKLYERSINDPDGFLGRTGPKPGVVQEMGQGPGL